MPDRFANVTPTRDSYGRVAVPISPSDSTEFPAPFKAIEVRSIAGGATLRILPVGNADGEWVDYVGVGVGFRPGFRVRRVGAATTCAVVGVAD